MANRTMKITNHYNQDAVAEGTAIKRLIEKMIINVWVDKVHAYYELKVSF